MFDIELVANLITSHGYTITTIIVLSNTKCHIQHSLVEVHLNDEGMPILDVDLFCNSVQAALRDGKKVMVHNNQLGGQISQCMLCACRLSSQCHSIPRLASS